MIEDVEGYSPEQLARWMEQKVRPVTAVPTVDRVSVLTFMGYALSFDDPNVPARIRRQFHEIMVDRFNLKSPSTGSDEA